MPPRCGFTHIAHIARVNVRPPRYRAVMDDMQPVMTLTPELDPRRDVVAVTMGMPDGMAPGRLQSFADGASAVLLRLGAAGVTVTAAACLLRVWVAVEGAPDGDAAVLEGVRLAEDAAGGWLVVDGAERGGPACPVIS